MAKRRELIIVIEDMIKYGESALAFVDGLNYQDYLSDTKTKYAVYRCFEVIGEAAGSISKEDAELYSDIDWKGITGLRNIIIHDYDGINDQYIWAVIDNKLQPLIDSLKQILKKLDA